MIQDSGDRREFESGAVRDMAEGKGRCEMYNCKLVLATIYEDCDNILHMKLVYTYTDELGKHELTFPNVELPFEQTGLPDITHLSEDGAVLVPDKRMRLLEGFVYWSNEKHYFFDRITEPKIHRMTVEEIEEELGYKIEIVT